MASCIEYDTNGNLIKNSTDYDGDVTTWNKLQKGFVCAVLALLLGPAAVNAQATEVTETAVNNTITPRVGVDFNTPRNGDGERSFGRVTGFIPLWQTPGNGLTFLDTAVRLNSTGELGGTVTLGQRFRQGNVVLGGHLSYDIRDTGNNTFNQLGLGVEAHGELWDIHLNGYLPVGNTQSSSGGSGQVTGTRFQGNQLVFLMDGGIETALGGVDLDAGMQLAGWDDWGQLWGYGGAYYYGDAIGGRLRVEHRVQDWLRLGLGVQSDGNFGTQGFFSVGFSWGGETGSTDEDSQDDALWARAAESVTRNSSIVVKESEAVEVAINPATGQAYSFQHVTPDATSTVGDGTIENPAANVNLVNAQTGDIVYVREGDSRTNPLAPFTVPAGVTVISDANLETIATQAGNVALPGSGTGILPLVNATGSNVGITLTGGNNRLSGFEISGATGTNILVDSSNNALIENNFSRNSGGGAIFVRNSEAITIQNNQVTDTATDITANSVAGAISLQDVVGTVNISGNTVTGTTGTNELDGQGIAIANATGDMALTIDNNTINNNQGDGIGIALVDASTTAPGDATADINITNNRISNNGVTAPLRGDGIRVAVEENGVINSLLIEGNTLTGNADDGIDISAGLAQLLTVIVPDPNISSSNAQILNAVIRNNTVTDSVNGEGILLRSFGDNSSIAISVEDNTLTNNATGGLKAISTDTNGAPETRLCLALNNNTSDGDYTLIETFPLLLITASRFSVVNRDGVDAANTGTVVFNPVIGSFDEVGNISACP